MHIFIFKNNIIHFMIDSNIKMKKWRYTRQIAIKINMLSSINSKLRGKKSNKMQLNAFVYIISIFASAYKLLCMYCMRKKVC